MVKEWRTDRRTPREVLIDPQWLDLFGEISGALYKEELSRRNHHRKLFNRFFRKINFIDFARENLTRRQFQVFEMHYIKRMEVTLIAERLGVQQSTVSRIIQQIGARLRKRLIKRGILKR